MSGDISDIKVGQVIKKYRLAEELGRGGMGVVFRAVDSTLGRDVAIKFQFSSEPDKVARFLREAIAACRVQHPQVVQVYEVDKTDDGVLFIVMEYVKGQTLTELIRRAAASGSRVGPEYGVAIAWQIASVLSETHARGVVHRDLKPANIMTVQYRGMPGDVQVKILDFGIAKLLPGITGDDPQGVLGIQLTGSDQRPGTPAFMPPEQWQTNSLDAKVDVYALGCMLYLFLAGRVPFVAGNSAGLQILHQIETPKSLLEFDATLAPELVAICERMLEKNPAQRPSMDVVRDELSKLLGLDAPHPARKLRTSKEISTVPAPKGSGSGDSLPNTASALTVDATGGGSSSGLTIDVPSASGSGGAVLEKSTPMLAASPARTPAAGEQTSGLGSRATGQQLPGAGSDDARSRRRLGYAVAALLAVSILLTVGILKWQQKPSQTPAATTGLPVSTATQPAGAAIQASPTTSALPPATTAATKLNAEAQPPDPASPLASTSGKSRPTKAPKSACPAVEVTEDCLSGALSVAQRKGIVAAAREAKITLCPADHLGLVSKPALAVVGASGVSKAKREHFEVALRGALGTATWNGKVDVRCDGK